MKKITTNTDSIEVSIDTSYISEMNQMLVLAGINITEIKIIAVSHEDYFLEKMGTFNVGRGVGKYA